MTAPAPQSQPSSETARWLRAFASDTFGVTIKSEQQKCMLEAADEIAALRAKVDELTGAEKALRDEIWHLRGIVTDVRVMANAGQFEKFEGEPWLMRARNIDLHHDPVATDIAFRAALAVNSQHSAAPTEQEK